MQPDTRTPIRRLVTALVLAAAFTSVACHAAPTGVGSGATIIPGPGVPDHPPLDTLPRPMIVAAGAPNVVIK